MTRREDGSPTNLVSYHSTWTIEGELCIGFGFVAMAVTKLGRTKRVPPGFHEARIRTKAVSSNHWEWERTELRRTWNEREMNEWGWFSCDVSASVTKVTSSNPHRQRSGATTTVGRTNGGTFRGTCRFLWPNLEKGGFPPGCPEARIGTDGATTNEERTRTEWLEVLLVWRVRLSEDAFCCVGPIVHRPHHILLYHSCSFLVCKQPPFTVHNSSNFEVKCHLSLSYWLTPAQKSSHSHCRKNSMDFVALIRSVEVTTESNIFWLIDLKSSSRVEGSHQCGTWVFKGAICSSD